MLLSVCFGLASTSVVLVLLHVMFAVLSVVAAEWIELYKRSQAYEARP